MKRRVVVVVMAAVLLCIGGSAASAIDALIPGGATPLQIVTVRKATMQAVFANYADARAKLTAGTIKAISANGKALAAMLAAVPYLFGDAYGSVYPVGASKYFFKGGAVADFRNVAQAFVTASEELVKLADADDKAGVEAQIPKVFATCGACHGVFRGQQP